MSAKKELPSLRILIVEDNVDIAENIADYLEVQGMYWILPWTVSADCTWH